VANRLADATSPYLLQHKDNPVDWWEWSEEAFAEARRRDVPVLVSVGYSACHWCHVMAHESFEDEATAALMNEHFVSIKVDREERPDVDAVYMQATTAMTGHGGWPMTVVANPDGEPFFCGTYFPDRPRQGQPAFTQVLQALSEAWRERRGEVDQVAGQVREHLRSEFLTGGEGDVDTEVLAGAMRLLVKEYDARAGGFGGAPKFPPSMVLEFLLRHAARTRSPNASGMAQGTLEAMARGGIYDQLAGGFARYSVDKGWVVPHFEKMLYDNAQLVGVYARWWTRTGVPLGARVARETARFLLDELGTPEGGFASGLDADTEGVEGRFYVWSRAALDDVLGDADGAWAAQLLGVTPDGTFEHGTSTLQLRADPDDLDRWARVRRALLAARATRTRPARDDKVVAAWNGLAVASLAEAGVLLGEEEYVEAAARAAGLLLDVHLVDGTLFRVSRDGRPGRHAGVLEDHGCVSSGLLALFQATGDERWVTPAGVLLDTALARFRADDGGFFDTADDAEQLVARPRDPTDNASPSGLSSMVHALLTWSSLTGSGRHRDAAEAALRTVRPLTEKAPRFAGWSLAAAEAAVAGPVEVAVVGHPGNPGREALLAEARRSAGPGAVVVAGVPGGDAAVPLLESRGLVDGRAAAYVCRGMVCRRPVTTVEELRGELRSR
jgi:uncharacterized protein YyaL (SSP411 family)